MKFQKINYFFILVFIFSISALYVYINFPKIQNHKITKIPFLINYRCKDSSSDSNFLSMQSPIKFFLESETLKNQIMASVNNTYSLEQLKSITLEAYPPLYFLVYYSHGSEEANINKVKLLNLTLDKVEESLDFRSKDGTYSDCKVYIIRGKVTD